MSVQVLKILFSSLNSLKKNSLCSDSSKNAAVAQSEGNTDYSLLLGEQTLVRDSLNDLMQFTLISHFYLMQLQGEKNQKPDLYLQQAENFFVLIPQLFCLSTNSQKNLPTGTAGKGLTTAKYVFFIGAAIKIAVSFSEFHCLCADDLQRQMCSQRSCCSQILYFLFWRLVVCVRLNIAYN